MSYIYLNCNRSVPLQCGHTLGADCSIYISCLPLSQGLHATGAGSQPISNGRQNRFPRPTESDGGHAGPGFRRRITPPWGGPCGWPPVAAAP